MKRRAQSWSMDVVLAVVVFGFVSIAITSLLIFKETDVERLQNQAEKVVSSLGGTVQTCETVIDQNELNRTSLECLYGQDYDVVKEQLRLPDDFCIHLEDDNGDLIPITDTGGVRRNGFGANTGDFNVSGVPCGGII